MPQRVQRDPIVSSTLYKLLSSGFRYPTPGLFKTFQNGKFLDEMMYNISSIPRLKTPEHVLRQVRDALKEMTYAGFGIEFTRTFDSGAPVPPCPPYEGYYFEKPRSIVMLEVSEFYNCFGLRMSQEQGKREFPDHISAELEFLHFLTFQEARAMKTCDNEALNGYLLAQRDFLERHLMQWVPGFCNKLQKSESLAFYPLLAQITSRFIAAELLSVSKDR